MAPGGNPVGDFRLEICYVLQHVLQHDDLAHGAELARLLLPLAADDLALAAWLGPATAVRVCLLAPLLDLDLQRVHDAGLVGAEAGSSRPAVL
ncbi:unnamed protein product [Clonostachys byssicola]|uniref:Uncharacterized protein n=1 Tax=Clonostachys byssicola TaxID=160290 RepID=A0A9N9Y7S2_9HYPO|nr:unnamed protein product [Clonostachys byssicola]